MVRFSALGDVIQTLPVLSMLRDSFPDAQIGWAIDTELAPMIEGHPALAYVHRCSRRTWSKALLRPPEWLAAGRDFKAFVDEVRAVGYDVAIDAQGLFKTALLPVLAGISRRIGYKHGREFSSIFYTEQHVRRGEYFNPEVFHLEHMGELARSIGATDLRYSVEPPMITESARHRVSILLDNAFAAPAPIVAISPATQWSSKHWPEAYWTTLVSQLLSETDLNLLFQGAPADRQLTQRILRAIPHEWLAGRVLDVCGKVPIADMYALHQGVQAAIGPDSAPLHIAGAVGVPVLVGIYGPTGYRRTPPIGSPVIRLLSSEGQLACQPCHKRVCPLGTTECMLRIQPGEVFRALVAGLTEAGISFQGRGAATVT
ncbi:MAG TPA: glycosyltransferase family 9 protein [Terriglobales bacterium]|nr:glycosyltransferase family 9 protein [Terriglobales bacterium]